MSLNGIESSSGALVVTTTDGFAVSEAIIQEVEDGNFDSIRNTIVNFEFEDISIATIANTLKTIELIKDGDILVIVKDDNSAHEVIASGVTKEYIADGSTNQSVLESVPIMTGNTTPEGVCSASTAGSPAWYSFNADSANYWQTDPYGVATGWLQYQYVEAIIVNKYQITANSAIPDRTPKDWTIQASNTGAFAGEEVTLDTRAGNIYTALEVKTFTFTNSEPYLYYRINITLTNDGATRAAIAILNFIQADFYNIMDTTAISGGEIPSHAYRINESIAINDNLMSAISDSHIVENIFDAIEFIGGANSLATDPIRIDANAIPGAQAGDVAILFEADDDPLPALAAGWTQKHYYYNGCSHRISIKVLTSSDVSWTATTINDATAATMGVYRNLDHTSFTYTRAEDTTGAPNPPLKSGFAVTDISIASGTLDDDLIIATAQAGYTMIGAAISTGFGVSIMASHKFNPNETEDPGIFESGMNDLWVAMTSQWSPFSFQRLKTERTFDNMNLPADIRSIETKVQMSAIGNKMIDMSADIWKEL